MRSHIFTLIACTGSALGQSTFDPGAQIDDQNLELEPYPLLEAFDTVLPQFGFDGYGFRGWFGKSVSTSSDQLYVSQPYWFEDINMKGLFPTGIVNRYSTTTGQYLGVFETPQTAAGVFGLYMSASDQFLPISLNQYSGDLSDSVLIYDTNTHAFLRELIALDIGDLGQIIAMESRDELIAVLFSGSLSDSSRGTAVLFDASTGEQIAQYPANYQYFNDVASQAVTIDEDIIAVRNSPNHENSNIDVYDVLTNELLYSLQPPEPTPHFGVSLATNDDYIAVASKQPRPGDFYDADIAQVEVFDKLTGDSVQRFYARDGLGRQNFPNSIWMNERYIAVGSQWNRKVLLFDLVQPDRAWTVTPSYSRDGCGSSTFGSSITMDENFLYVGATESNCVTVYNIGCPADLNGDQRLSADDLGIFLDAYMSNNPSADYNNDQRFDYHDVSQFMRLYQAGCFE